MKKFILTTIFALVAMFSYCQGFNHERGHFKMVYRTVDTLLLKNVPTPNPTMNGDYLITLHKEQKIIIAYNNDHSKAIVLHGYMWGKRMEFNVKYEGSRLILWYKDDYLYCGYIYDEKVKACQYFEAISESEKEKITKKFPFLDRMPTFPTTE